MTTGKHFLACLLLLAVPVCRSEAQEFPASDSRITWVGRTAARGADVSFDWSGVYALVQFRGDTLRLRASDTGKDYFNVWYDRDAMTALPDTTFCLSSKDTTLTLFAGAPGEHRLIVQKRTEGEQGCATFHAFCADSLGQARPVRERVIEFVGDSYTCGYGTLSDSARDPFTPETEDCNRTYAAVIARHFGADFWLVAHSGMGIARNYGDMLPGYYMPDRYLQTFDERKQPAWAADKYRIKDNYGEAHPVLCVVPKGRDIMFDYIKAAMLACQMKQVTYMVLTSSVHDSEGELGASYHPNWRGQLKKAYAIIPYVSTLTGWPLEDEPLR